MYIKPFMDSLRTVSINVFWTRREQSAGRGAAAASSKTTLQQHGEMHLVVVLAAQLCPIRAGAAQGFPWNASRCPYGARQQANLSRTLCGQAPLGTASVPMLSTLFRAPFSVRAFRRFVRCSIAEGSRCARARYSSGRGAWT